MQVLMTEDAYRRQGAALKAIRPDAVIVRLTAPDAFVIDDAPVAAEAVDPEVVWVTLDSYFSGLMKPLFSVITRTRPKWVQSSTAGLDMPVWKTVFANGARVTKAAGQAVPIAEFVLAHALSLIVPVDAQREAQARHEWRQIPYREVGHTTWTIVGWGEIGQEVAARAEPFGVRIQAVRRSAGPDARLGRTHGLADVPKLLPESDVVVLSLPATAETRGLCDADFFAAMKPGSILINIARGALIDEAALKAALDQDRPAHAVLDAFEAEPLSPDSWLWDHPKVRVTAHTSWNGDGVGGRMDQRFLENFRRYGAGEPLLNEAGAHEAQT